MTSAKCGLSRPSTGSSHVATSRTARRAGSLGVPIPAVAVRELVYDAIGQIVRTPRKEAKRPRWEWFWTRGRSVEPVASAAELEPGQTRKETEGVFTIRSGVVQF